MRTASLSPDTSTDSARCKRWMLGAVGSFRFGVRRRDRGQCRRPESMLRVLVVDDEKNIRSTLALALEGMGCAVGLAATAESALAQAGREAFDLALVDLKLAQGSGLDLIPRLIAENPGLDVVVITAYATIDTAVEAMRRGALDYLPKPFTPAQIRHLVERTAERRA